jgi:AcrR family transcriptional regulator
MFSMKGERMARQQRGQETRLRLLEVAQERFSQQGYDATGVAEICRHAGVSKGAFYHHFPSKQDLFIALLDRWLDNLDEQLAALRADAPDALAGLQHMTAAIEPIFAEASGQLPLFLEFLEQARRDPVVWEATIAPYRRYRAYFARLIADGAEEGALRAVDPDLASAVLVSLAVGALLQSLLDPDGADWGEVVRAGVRMLTPDSD